MKFFSELHCELFVFDKTIEKEITPKIHINTEIKKITNCTSHDWKKIKGLQGSLRVKYLKLKYGSDDTYVLCGYADCGELTHVEWVVPAKKMRMRYPFINKNCYAIISCLTSSKYRGMCIYPSQLQEIAKSEIPAKEFYIWAESKNTPSIKGIIKAGAKKTADIIQRKYFYGLFSKIKISGK